jgi:uncharacterized protein with FMN-binding domain
MTVTDTSGKYAAFKTTFTLSEAAAQPTEQTYSITKTVDPANSSYYAEDGAEFDAYDLVVDVTVFDGKVVSVALNESNTFNQGVASSGDVRKNKTYSNNAISGLSTTLVDKTAAEIDGVDVVSEATCSSTAIKQAVSEALSK